jgi:hypothetical protein
MAALEAQRGTPTRCGGSWLEKLTGGSGADTFWAYSPRAKFTWRERPAHTLPLHRHTCLLFWRERGVEAANASVKLNTAPVRVWEMEGRRADGGFAPAARHAAPWFCARSLEPLLRTFRGPRKPCHLGIESDAGLGKLPDHRPKGYHPRMHLLHLHI